MDIINVVFVVLPILNFSLIVWLLLFLAKYISSKFGITLSLTKPTVTLIVITLIVCGWQLVNSPITTPVNDLHNKSSEVRMLKQKDRIVNKPVLVDNSRKSESKDLSETPLLDKALAK